MTGVCNWRRSMRVNGGNTDYDWDLMARVHKCEFGPVYVGPGKRRLLIRILRHFITWVPAYFKTEKKKKESG